MEPTEALRSIETVLRLVVRDVLGERWLASPGAQRAGTLERSRSRDVERRPGLRLPDELLEYTETRELTALIRKNWAFFEPVFGEKERTFGLLRVLDDERFSVAHSRDLVPFERELLSGIAGQLRQQIGIWRNRDDPSTRFYPRIEKVRDTYGIDGEAVGYSLSPAGEPRLEVGETLTYSCAAFGHQTHSVRWRFRTGGWIYGAHPGEIVQHVAEGDRVELHFTITEEHIAEKFLLSVYIETESRWKRHATTGEYDDVRHFIYAVNPPPD